jgi:hypothetical protein
MSTPKWKRPNAQKHGVFSATAILPGEDEEEFKELHTALIDEWRPVGATEEDAVLSIAKAVWRKRRVQKFLEVQLKQNTADPNHPAYQESVSLTALLVHMTNAPSEMPFGEYAPFYLRPNRIKFLQEKCPRGRFNSNSQLHTISAQKLSELSYCSIRLRISQAISLSKNLLWMSGSTQ